MDGLNCDPILSRLNTIRSDHDRINEMRARWNQHLSPRCDCAARILNVQHII